MSDLPLDPDVFRLLTLRNTLVRATGSSDKNIVCKTCAHQKVWHRDEGLCSAPEGPDWACDCQAWVYGVNVLELPLPDDSEDDAWDLEQERE
jgi:hypothetical protein